MIKLALTRIIYSLFHQLLSASQPWLATALVLSKLELQHTHFLSIWHCWEYCHLPTVFPSSLTVCWELVKTMVLKTVSEQLHLHVIASKTIMKGLKMFYLSRFVCFHTTLFAILSFSVQFHDSHITHRHTVELVSCTTSIEGWVISLYAYYTDICGKASAAVPLIIFTF